MGWGHAAGRERFVRALSSPTRVTVVSAEEHALQAEVAALRAEVAALGADTGPAPDDDPEWLAELAARPAEQADDDEP